MTNVLSNWLGASGYINRKVIPSSLEAFQFSKSCNENYFSPTECSSEKIFNRLIGSLRCLEIGIEREIYIRKYQTFLIFDDNPEISYQSKVVQFPQNL